MNSMIRTGCVLALLAPCTVLAESPATATPDTLTQLEARIQALEADAQARRQEAAEAMAALQDARAQIEQLRLAAASVPPAPSTPSPVTTAAADTSANAFNPAISVILNGTYANHSVDPDDYLRAGFPLAGEAGPGADGLSLGESEIAMSANVDDKFYGQLTLAVGSEDGNDEIGIEEAYIESTALPGGLTLRAGRFS